MKPSTMRLRVLPAAVVAVVIASALVLPSALGAVRPDDRGGVVGVGGSIPVAAGLVGFGRLDASSEPVLHGTGGLPVVAEQSSGTDWAAILVGAGVVALAAVIAVAAVETARHHGGPGRAIPH